MKKNLYLLLCFALFVVACRKNNDSVTPTVTPKMMAFDSDQNSTLMFQDTESMAVMTSDDRRYNIAHIIRVKPVDNNNIEVANFAPFDIENATILATISGSTTGSALQVVKLFTISKIRAHAKQTIKYPFVDGTTLFLDTNNKTVDLSQYKTNGIAAANVSFDFTGDNPTIQKLNKLARLKWDIQYHDYNPDKTPGSNWDPNFNAKKIRAYTGLMINLGIALASDDFKQQFLNEPIIGNDGVTALTDAEKLKTYNDIINFNYLLCGSVDGGSAVGLGGGSTYGLAAYLITGNYTYISYVGFGDTAAHEFGHCVGYNHSSNMTYPQTINGVSTGFSPVLIRVWQKLYNNGSFATTLTNYYKPTDFK